MLSRAAPREQTPYRCCGARAGESENQPLDGQQQTFRTHHLALEPSESENQPLSAQQ